MKKLECTYRIIPIPRELFLSFRYLFKTMGELLSLEFIFREIAYNESGVASGGKLVIVGVVSTGPVFFYHCFDCYASLYSVRLTDCQPKTLLHHPNLII